MGVPCGCGPPAGPRARTYIGLKTDFIPVFGHLEKPGIFKSK
jgi:hypothetical protein